MKRLVKYVYIICSIIFLLYLALPTQPFPKAPRNWLQSSEPADTETSLRRAYFTDLNRQEALDYYQSIFIKSPFLSIALPTYRLNYPPEDGKTIIRDQTRSSYLEEIVHPFRESLFVNGFIPTQQKDAINVGGKIWFQKITVRFIPGSFVARVIAGGFIILLTYLVYKLGKMTIVDFRKALK